MDYIFPVPTWLRGKLLSYKRLYAFPTIPEDDPFILDSGAFALSKSDRRMDVAYLESLYQYYKKYQGWKVAPDVYLNSRNTMRNFDKWMKTYSDCELFPVIQCQTKSLEWEIIRYQLDFYADYFSYLPVLFFSNPGLKAFQYPNDFFQKIKNFNRLDIIKIHNLGAGFDISDIQGYMNLSGLDSVDSISYYNATNQVTGNWTGIKGNREKIAIANVEYVSKIIV